MKCEIFTVAKRFQSYLCSLVDVHNTIGGTTGKRRVLYSGHGAISRQCAGFCFSFSFILDVTITCTALYDNILCLGSRVFKDVFEACLTKSLNYEISLKRQISRKLKKLSHTAGVKFDTDWKLWFLIRHQMEAFSRYWPFVRGIHRSPVNSLHKGHWCGALKFSFVCAWINGWVNNRKDGDLRRHRAHYNVIVMLNRITPPGKDSHYFESGPRRLDKMTPQLQHWFNSGPVLAHTVYFHWKARVAMMPTLPSLATP